MALRFAEEGASVFLVDRRLKSAEETLAMVAESGGNGVAHEADVTSEAACAGMVDACSRLFGRIDILHNNVGIGAGDRGPTNMTEEVWDRIHTTNLKSVMFTCKRAADHARAAQRRDHQHRRSPRCVPSASSRTRR
jgi:NAD(P)-dependent dehydrogenase (short-subunit alcohol dehydrogenase family)